MRFRFIFLFFLFLSCSPQLTTLNQAETYTSKGFAYIYNNNDFDQKIIKGRMDNEIMQISHQNLKTGTLIKITNPRNNESIVLKNVKRIRYPDFYKVLITKPVAEKLDLNLRLPIIEITEIKKIKILMIKKQKYIMKKKKFPQKLLLAL